MSTQPPTTTTPTPTPTPTPTETETTTARTTETGETTEATPTTPSRFRGGRDRWRAADDPEPAAAAQAPRTFDPFCRYRLPNRIDAENQAMLRDRSRDQTDTD